VKKNLAGTVRAANLKRFVARTWKYTLVAVGLGVAGKIIGDIGFFPYLLVWVGGCLFIAGLDRGLQ
jgi:hypothetical protein